LFTSFVDTDYSPEVLSVHAVPVPEPSVLFALFTQMVTTSGYGASFFAIFHFTIAALCILTAYSICQNQNQFQINALLQQSNTKNRLNGGYQQENCSISKTPILSH